MAKKSVILVLHPALALKIKKREGMLKYRKRKDRKRVSWRERERERLLLFA